MENNELIKTEGQDLSNVLPEVFKNVDFSGLNGAIEALGKHSGDLDKDEKDAAVEILNEWNENVIERLRMHNNDMNSLISFFKGIRYYYNNDPIMTEDRIQAIAASTKTEALYEAYLKAKEELEVISTTCPESPIKDDTKSILEQQKERQLYDYEYAVYNNNLKKANIAATKTYNAWIKAINEHSLVKDMLSKANKFNRSLNKLINECNSKTSLAKLNVKIGSEDVRNTLKELLNFTSTI